MAEAVESVALNPVRIESAGKRQQARHARHRGVKRSIEARDLQEFRITSLQRFDQTDLGRQMIRVVPGYAAQLFE